MSSLPFKTGGTVQGTDRRDGKLERVGEALKRIKKEKKPR